MNHAFGLLYVSKLFYILILSLFLSLYCTTVVKSKTSLVNPTQIQIFYLLPLT